MERFHTGDEQHHALLPHCGETKVMSDLVGWFNFYNRWFVHGPDC